MSDVTPSAEPAPLDLTGRSIGDFQVLRKLGQGGMGQVYLARQLSLKREVALKILRDELAANTNALKRFQAEAEAVARVTHANIVQVYAVGEQDGLRYMVLEFVDGRNLRDHLSLKGLPELPVALSIMRQVAAALQRASESGLVHRDIKPENILLTKKYEVKVADFGLSRYFAGDEKAANLTQSGMTLGTPLYMSPEQVQGKSVDHRSDIYSFGVTCYHLLAGQPPFRGVTAFEITVQHVQNDPPPLATTRPDLPADLCAVVHKMMAKRPEDRYQTARDIIRDLAKIQKGLAVGLPSPTASSTSAPMLLPVSATTTAMLTPPAKSPWPRRFAVVLGMVVLAAIGWGGYALVHPTTAPAQIAAGPGLPEARPPEPVSTTRERELTATLQNRASKPAEVLDAAVELGLLYLRERRWDDAERVFKDLEQERPAGRAVGAVVAGLLGQAVVLAHRDKAKESNDLIEKVVANTAQTRLVQKFLVDHPDLAQAVADGLTRNADNLNLTKLPDRLDWLRTPGGVLRGPGPR